MTEMTTTPPLFSVSVPGQTVILFHFIPVSFPLHVVFTCLCISTELEHHGDLQHSSALNNSSPLSSLNASGKMTTVQTSHRLFTVRGQRSKVRCVSESVNSQGEAFTVKFTLIVSLPLGLLQPLT